MAGRGIKKRFRSNMDRHNIDQMHVDWDRMVGQTAGRWRLDSFVGAREEQTDYTGRDPEGNRVWVQLLRSDSAGAPAAREAWALARNLSHDHLIRVHDCGEAEIEGVHFDYAVMEQPDDDIGEILSGRTLEDDEARAMTLAAGSALAYLHERSLQHGAVTPPNMYIFGDGVKLGVDGIAHAGDEGIAFDLQQFGHTLARALEGNSDPNSAYVLRQPFRDIAVGCEDPRQTGWTAQQIVDRIEGRNAALPRSGLVERMAGILRALAARPVWAVGGVAAVALASFLMFRGGQRAPAPVAKAVPAPITVAANPPETRPSPVRGATAKARPDADRASSVLPKADAPVRSGWAVIAATYRSYDSAQGRAQRMARSSRLHPRVYPPAGKASLYYVVLGSGLTQKEAERLRRTARQSGAPPDTYVTKLKVS
jgi:hypothetical protein